MKYLLAGFGSIGRRHFRNLLSLGERDIVVYHTRHSTLPDEELSGFAVESDLRAALAYEPDAAIIANPTALHLEVAIPAAQCGCHLLIEKPLSHSSARLDELKLAVDHNHCRVLVGYQFRFHPGLQQLKKLLNQGMIGQPVSVRAHWGEYLPSWHPWEDFKKGYAARPELGGGAVLTLSHPLDYLRWLLGEVDSLHAFTSNKGLNLPVEDTAEISLRFKNGTVGGIHLDYLQRPPSHWLEVIGTQGTLRWNDADGITHLAQAGMDDQAEAWQSFHPPEGFERNAMFLDELRHFREVLDRKVKPLCNLYDGIQALQLSLDVLSSSKQEKMIKIQHNN